MNAHNFILNAAFKENSKEYQTRPVRAAKYRPGVETGFMVYYANKPSHEKGTTLHEGMKFFDTEVEAWDYIRADNRQYAKENGVLVEFDVEYDPPRAVLHRKESDIEKKTGFINSHEGDHAFISDETEQYDFFILSNDYGEGEAWIIQDMDGNVRVWYNDLEDETFFGRESDIVFEKVGRDGYIKVAV